MDDSLKNFGLENSFQKIIQKESNTQALLIEHSFFCRVIIEILEEAEIAEKGEIVRKIQAFTERYTQELVEKNRMEQEKSKQIVLEEAKAYISSTTQPGNA